MRISLKYRPLLIKEYRWWSLLLHTEQHPYIGRCYAWWSDLSPGEGEGFRPSDVPPEALLELNRTIFDEVTDGCAALGYTVDPYGEDFLLNMAYFANEAEHNHHMHWHFVPRNRVAFLSSPLNTVVEGRQWGKNYAPYETVPATPAQLRDIRLIMAKAIGGMVDDL